MYRVIGLKENGKKIQVITDQEIKFQLYKGEIKKYHIYEGCTLDGDMLALITELLYKRARERALYILDRSYKTKKQIVDKLKNNMYPDCIIRKVTDYLEEYQLIDDNRFAIMYIDYKSGTRSKKQIVQDLYQKGISREIIEKAFENSGYTDKKSLEKLLEKKISKYDLAQTKDLQKLYCYLVQKGYQYGEIKEAIEKYRK